MEFLDLKTDDIVSNALQKLNDFTNFTFLSPGSKARLLVDILSEELGLQSSEFDSNIAAGFLRKAQGVTLDAIAEIYGLERLTEVRAKVLAAEQNFYLYTLGLNFGSINNGLDITIEPGELRFSNLPTQDSNSIIYTNVDKIILKNTENKIYFAAQSLTPGAGSNIGANTLNYHTFTKYADSLNQSLLVTNNNTISYGRDRESDENFRYRIQKEKISSEAGNETAIRLALLVIPGISNVTRIPYVRGIGTADWLISSTSVAVSNELIAMAQNAIDKKESSGMSNLARSPVLIGLEFVFSLTYRGQLETAQKEKIKSDIKKNISDYVNNLQIGETLILDQIIRIILSSSDLIESMGDSDSSENFKNVFLYKRSGLSNLLTRKTLTSNYTTKQNERVVLETTIENPIVIIDNN